MNGSTPAVENATRVASALDNYDLIVGIAAFFLHFAIVIVISTNARRKSLSPAVFCLGMSPLGCFKLVPWFQPDALSIGLLQVISVCKYSYTPL